jgi:hypothetical protein
LAKGAIFANVGKITPRGNISEIESSSEEFVRAGSRAVARDYDSSPNEGQDFIGTNRPSQFIPIDQIEVKKGNIRI